MTNCNAEITTTVLVAMRSQLKEVAAIAKAAEACATDGQPARPLTIALDVEQLAVEANQLLQGLAILKRVACDEQQQQIPSLGARCCPLPP